MNVDKIRSIIEAIIFASEQPVTLDQLALAVDSVDKQELGVLLEQLVVDWRGAGRSFHLVEVAGGWQFRTKAEYGPWVQRMAHDRPTKLSRASLETLAVIAYKQPITRPEIEDLRGVDSGAVVKNLLDRNLIKMVGKKDAPGKPVVYGTTQRFLEVFSLRDLGSLPSLRDLKELEEGEAAQLALPGAEGEVPEGEAAGEPKVVTDSERRRLIRESVRGLLSTPIGEDGAPLALDLPEGAEEEDALAELEAALKRRKEAAERAEAVFDESEKDYIEKVTNPDVSEPLPGEAPAEPEQAPAPEASEAPPAPAAPAANAEEPEKA